MDKDKWINIALGVVILAAIFSGRYYYSQSTETKSSIENVQKKIDQIHKNISDLKTGVNNLGIRPLTVEKNRWERQQEQLKKELNSI